MDTIKQVKVDKLVIKFNTNIPSKTEQLVEFTRSMLHIPVDPSIPNTNDIILEKYPFITADVKYPRKYLSRLNYRERLAFFFNEGVFTDTLSKHATRSSKNRSKQYLFEKNVLIMLDILFPTSFPVASNVSMSKDALYGNTSTTYSAKPRSIFDALSMNVGPTFSYLTIKGKNYTVQKLVWLNDLLNHPLYYKLIDSYRKYRDDTQDKKPQTQRVFKSLLREFQTIRLSTNTKLQELINEFSDDDSSKLPALFDYVIGHYLEGNVGKNTDFFPMLDVGVSTLNVSDPSQPNKEIYVMVDLINKEVSKENKKDVNCSYLDQHLGNQITYLWKNSQMSDAQSWNVMKNRGVFNVDASNIDKSTGTGTGTGTRIGESSSSILTQRVPLVDDAVKTNFQTNVVDNAPDLNNMFDEYITTYNVKYSSLFDFLKNSSGYATKIYDYIQLWNKSLDTRSVSLVANMQKTLGELNGVIQGLNTQYSAEVNPTKKDNMRRDIALHELYKTLITELLNNENTKKLAYAGGRRTRRNKKRRTKKHYKQSYKKRII